MTTDTSHGTFDIFDKAGELQVGCITNMFDAAGAETDCFDEAAQFIGVVLEGTWAGHWVTFPANAEDELHVGVPA